MKKIIFLAFAFSGLYAEAQQSFAGVRESNFAGVYQVTANPAYMGSNKRLWDVNILSVNGDFNNNSIPLTTDLNKSFNDYTRADQQNAFLKLNDLDAKVNVDVLGPSFFLRVANNHSVGIFSRIRVLGNVKDINPKLLQSMLYDYNKIDLQKPYEIDINNQEVIANAFSEIGLSWAGELYFSENSVVKAGASIKIVRGAGNLYAGFHDFNGTATLRPDPVNQKVYLDINSAGGNFEVLNGGTDFIEDFNANKLFRSEATTVGLDLGAIYEWRREGCPTCHNLPYDLRIGVSLMDIGRISYNANNESYRYTLPNQQISIDLDELSQDELTKAIGNRPKGVRGKLNSSLPTTFNASVDYRIVNGFYANFSSQFNLAGKKSEVYSAVYANEFTLTPRFDSNSFGAYLPISYNEMSKAHVGLALRLGPLTLGSSTLLSNAFGKEAKELNFFVGLRFGHMSFYNNND